MILEGGRIYTGDPALPRVHALPIDDRGRVSRGVEAWEGDTSAVSNERVDLAGRTVVPGFRDAGCAFSKRALAEVGERPATEALAAAQRRAHADGVIGILDLTPGPEALLAWQALDRDERATLRMTIALDAIGARNASAVGIRSHFGSDRVRIGPAVLDPRLSDTATMVSDLSTRGIDILYSASDEAAVAAAAACRTEEAPDAHAAIAIRAAAPAPDGIELPVVALFDDGAPPVALDAVVQGTHVLAVGSGDTPSPPLALVAALRRAGADPARALAAVTTAPAAIAGEPARTGTLAPGAPADLVVLDGDPSIAAPDEIASIPVLAAMVAGRWVVGRPPW